MKISFTKESATALFYIVCLLITYCSGILTPNSLFTPVFGALWALFFVVASFVLFFVHLYRFSKGKKSYINCLLIDALAWSVVFTVEYLKHY